MGSCHSHKNFVGLSLQSVAFSHIFIFLLLLSTANSAKSSKRRQRSCDVDRCSQLFHTVEEMSIDIDKCRQLSSHRDCLMSMSDVCRGNLLYHTSVHVNEERLKKLNCVEIFNNLPTGDGIKTPSPGRTNQCIYAGKPKFKLCSLFGDPHVRSFSDKCHTCKANGSWPLINNDYLVVKATNSLLKGQMQATAISKLVVIIRESGECAKERTYLAEIGNRLSATFTDGTTHTGLEKSVNVTEKEKGKEIQIDIRFIATTIVIRNVGSHLTFSVQMPDEIVKSPVDGRHQMCVRGCPKRQRIRLKQEFTRLTTTDPTEDIVFSLKYTEQEARRRCRDALLGRDDEEEDSGLDRQRRTAGKRRNSQQRRDAELDASAQSWRQLTHSHGGGGKSRSSSRSKKGRNRNRSTSGRRTEPSWEDFLQDDPGVGRFRGGRKERNRGVVSSVGRGTNFYFEACVFDLMTTGDVTYASSARGAFDDVTRFHRSGKNAKGASIKAINRYPIASTTSPPPKTENPQLTAKANTTKRTRVIQPTIPDNGSRPFSINFFLLIFCLFSSTYIFDLINFGLFFNINNTFFNKRKNTA